MAKTAKKKAAKKSPAPTRSKAPINLQPEIADTYEIDLTPPPIRKFAMAERLARIDRTIAVLKPGQAFTMPSKSRVIARRHISNAFPYDVFSFQKIAGNDELIRVYYVKSNKKPSK